ncbi:hypothetical protein B0H17DRAFT_1148047 [Mycena rosella]|uniref:Uncharacterized protein n=1 Tax=Mycena rosella TaxID=1033263 RepID=A0AAD7CGY1_MYCRO|nr:hypothetical protein B0H17DRAFT_1148047 [Mycena rosella]
MTMALRWQITRSASRRSQRTHRWDPRLDRSSRSDYFGRRASLATPARYVRGRRSAAGHGRDRCYLGAGGVIPARRSRVNLELTAADATRSARGEDGLSIRRYADTFARFVFLITWGLDTADSRATRRRRVGRQAAGYWAGLDSKLTPSGTVARLASDAVGYYGPPSPPGRTAAGVGAGSLPARGRLPGLGTPPGPVGDSGTWTRVQLRIAC